MKLRLALCLVIGLLLAVPTAAGATGYFSETPVFGVVTYADADRNGFADATWLGLRLQGEYELPHQFAVGYRYDYGLNTGAVGQDPAWRDLVPELTGEGRVIQSRHLYSLLYGAGLRFGAGYFVGDFVETEYGFREGRTYRGACLVGEANLNQAGVTKVGLVYAPSLAVADDVKGDWDDAERTAAVSYPGSYWEVAVDHTFVDRGWYSLHGGLEYSMLSGQGADHPEYRFLGHHLTTKGFHLELKWKL